MASRIDGRRPCSGLANNAFKLTLRAGIDHVSSVAGEPQRLADGTFPVEWTNVKKADCIETRGTFADWGTMHR